MEQGKRPQMGFRGTEFKPPVLVVIMCGLWQNILLFWDSVSLFVK